MSLYQTVHLEITTRCNASCPLCARNLNGGVTDPNLKLAELSLEDVRQALPESFLRQLIFLYACGNFGDPALGQETLEIFSYLRRANSKLRLMMMTNGSVRSTEWWQALAGVIDECEFGIDGMADTHALHRRGTSFQKVMENARAFIEAGGYASWQFIVFKHNEHQIDQARELARELGFKKFFVKRTSRFFSSFTRQVSETFPVHDKNGNVEYELEMPSQMEWRNSSYKELAEANFDQCDIRCKSVLEKSLYLSAEGYLWPCCWLGNHRYSDVQRLIGDGETLNALKHPIEQILQSDFFVHKLPASWKKKSLQEGKLRMCAKTCGSQADLFKAQFHEL